MNCMREYNLINIIKNSVNNEFIGDDCAYLKDFDLVVTQDSLIENIHFKRSWYTPYQLGYKSVIVNISDILASGAEPKYITVSLSVPSKIDEEYIKAFYEGIKSGLSGAQIIGGDITGSKNDIMISITAIGSTLNRNISSRKNAKIGYKIITKGLHGDSAAGLKELLNNGNNKKLINAHISPKLEYKFSNDISTSVNADYAMMDTSDGIADALFKIAEASKVKISVDYNKIPHSLYVNKQQVLFGGEDFKLIAAIPEKFVPLIEGAVVIGEVQKFDGIRLDISGDKYKNYNELNVFNHFN